MLERNRLLLGIEVVDILMLETPSAVDLPDVRLESEEWHRTKRHSIFGFDEASVLTLSSDAMPEIAKKIQVLKTKAFDFGVAKSKQLSKRRGRRNECLHRLVQVGLNLDSSRERGRLRCKSTTPILDRKTSRAVAPYAMTERTQIDGDEVE